MKKRDKTIYWIATGILSIMTLFAGVMYFIQTPMVSDMFAQLGYPTYLVYPLGVAKLLAVVAILSRKSELLKKLAYAGLFYVFILASLAHWQAGVGSSIAPLVLLVVLAVSYFYDQKLSMKNSNSNPARTAETTG